MLVCHSVMFRQIHPMAPSATLCLGGHNWLWRGGEVAGEVVAVGILEPLREHAAADLGILDGLEGRVGVREQGGVSGQRGVGDQVRQSAVGEPGGPLLDRDAFSSTRCRRTKGSRTTSDF